ncbi:sulfite oxidase-like oxidoreductase [Geminicoccus roseus]|uniref:sulfite oxidase-like oxidoreductase n=1 Tax=Geminicoccus roseus TaxID=404900 RepID=UPI0004026F71|nr:sulfite oxidase-like oxidoreductase [Geminicoccus roseus]
MSDPQDDAPAPKVRGRLAEIKQGWAESGRFLTGQAASGEQRLPPGQHLVTNWPILDLGTRPRIPPERWQLRVFGAVEEAVTWDWDALLAQPQVRPVSDIHCVTTWSRYDNHWEGVATAQVLAAVRPKPEARFVVLHSYDDYTTNLPLDDFAAPGALLAHRWEGEALPVEHGGPVRLVVPHLYFWKSAKWLRRIEFVTEDRRGFWEERGYHDRGDPWSEQRYSEEMGIEEARSAI